VSAASGEAGKKMERFNSGATRSNTDERNDPEGFMSALAIERYCEYMTKHRKQADGTIRDSDNWQKGMPFGRALKRMWRHLMHLWIRHRGFNPSDQYAAVDMEEDLCAIMFNTNVMLHQLVKKRHEDQIEKDALAMITRLGVGDGFWQKTGEGLKWIPHESLL